MPHTIEQQVANFHEAYSRAINAVIDQHINAVPVTIAKEDKDL